MATFHTDLDEPGLAFWLLLKFAVLLTSSVILGWPISKLTQPELFPDSPPVLSCVKSRGSESRKSRVDSAWRKFPRWVPSIPTPLPLQIYGLTCAPRSGQTPLFHFLRLPRCRSNSGEANAGRLLNYERWAWVIPVIKSKGAGPMPHGTMVLLCGLAFGWNSQRLHESCQNKRDFILSEKSCECREKLIFGVRTTLQITP